MCGIAGELRFDAKSPDHNDLSSLLPCYVRESESSSILTLGYFDGKWVLGGYADQKAIVFLYEDNQLYDYSSLLKDMRYVIWARINRNES